MAAITVRNLSADTHQALKARAKRHGRSTEAEVRAILDAAAQPDVDAVRIGTLLADIGRSIGGVEIEYERERAGYEPVDLT